MPHHSAAPTDGGTGARTNNHTLDIRYSSQHSIRIYTSIACRLQGRSDRLSLSMSMSMSLSLSLESALVPWWYPQHWRLISIVLIISKASESCA